MGKADGGEEALRTRTGSGPFCCIRATCGGSGGDPAGPMAMAETGSMVKVDESVRIFDGTHDGPGGAGIWLLSQTL